MKKNNHAFPRWRQLLDSSLHESRSKPQAKFFQVANVDLNGLPKNRTLVFRGFAEGGNHILAITDSRSHKYSQWQSHAYAEICWYFDSSREQYRISCRIELIDCLVENQSIRAKLWSSLSRNARSQFFWPQPAEPYNENNLSLYNIDSEELDAGPPDSFVAVVFIPSHVDYLNLKTHPQIREVSSLIHATNIQKQMSDNVKHEATKLESKKVLDAKVNKGETTNKPAEKLNDEARIGNMLWHLCKVNT